ncbi:MAG: hypothetical protein ACE5L7_08420, partial [Candidatus Aminicenantales bacterium]
LRKEEKEMPVPFSIARDNGSLLLSHHRFYPYVENVFREGKEIALFLQIFTPQKAEDVPLQFILLQDENATFPVASEQIETLLDRKSKILNAVYILDFDEVPPGDYKLRIKSSEIPNEQEIGIKIIDNKKN